MNNIWIKSFSLALSHVASSSTQAAWILTSTLSRVTAFAMSIATKFETEKAQIRKKNYHREYKHTNNCEPLDQLTQPKKKREYDQLNSSKVSILRNSIKSTCSTYTIKLKKKNSYSVIKSGWGFKKEKKIIITYLLWN